MPKTRTHLTPRASANLRLLIGIGGSGHAVARCFNHQCQMKLAFENSGKSNKEARRSERSEEFGFHADNSIADWLNAYSRQVDCPTSAVIRASLIYFATATDPVKGRALLDSQKYQGSLREVMLLAMVRMISRGSK